MRAFFSRLEAAPYTAATLEEFGRLLVSARHCIVCVYDNEINRLPKTFRKVIYTAGCSDSPNHSIRDRINIQTSTSCLVVQLSLLPPPSLALSTQKNSPPTLVTSPLFTLPLARHAVSILHPIDAVVKKVVSTVHPHPFVLVGLAITGAFIFLLIAIYGVYRLVNKHVQKKKKARVTMQPYRLRREAALERQRALDLERGCGHRESSREMIRKMSSPSIVYGPSSPVTQSFVISICSTHKGIRKETDEMDITDASSDEFSTPTVTVGDGSKEESNVVNSLHDMEPIDSVEMDITDEGPNAMNSLQVSEVVDSVDSAPTGEVESSSPKTLPSHLLRTAAEDFATLRLEADHEPIVEEVKLVKEARSMTAPSLVKHIPNSIDSDASVNFATSQRRLRRNGFILSDKLLDIDFEAIDGLRYVQTSFEATAMTDMRRLALQRAQALYDREEARSVAATRQKDDAGTTSPAEVHTSSASYIAARPRMSSTNTATISRTPLPRRRLINPRAKTALRYARAILRTIERRYVIPEPPTEGSQVADRATYPPEDRVAPVLLFSKKAMKWKEIRGLELDRRKLSSKRYSGVRGTWAYRPANPSALRLGRVINGPGSVAAHVDQKKSIKIAVRNLCKSKENIFGRTAAKGDPRSVSGPVVVDKGTSSRMLVEVLKTSTRSPPSSPRPRPALRPAPTIKSNAMRGNIYNKRLVPIGPNPAASLRAHIAKSILDSGTRVTQPQESPISKGPGLSKTPNSTTSGVESVTKASSNSTRVPCPSSTGCSPTSCLESRKRMPSTTPSSTPSRPRPSTRANPFGTPSLALSTLGTRTVETSPTLESGHALATKTTSSSDTGTSRPQGSSVKRSPVLSDVSNCGLTHSPGLKEVISPSKRTLLGKASASPSVSRTSSVRRSTMVPLKERKNNSPSRTSLPSSLGSRSSTQAGTFGSSRVTSSPPRAPVIKRMSVTGSPVPRQIVPASKTSPRSSWR
ncbi:hypothetical protein DFH11DRAFT_1878989 [Phellopilus nigrolimitatus]|nr:hypothetical protein DFH11DRAFT_1878989 [Phellopilus nigrolimitatus]